jgi:hypothetical protein
MERIAEEDILFRSRHQNKFMADAQTVAETPA